VARPPLYQRGAWPVDIARAAPRIASPLTATCFGRIHAAHAQTRKLGLPAGGGALGHGSRAHADDEYIVTEGNDEVAGIVGSEQPMVELVYAFAHAPGQKRATDSGS
jgi:hypothetical protein